MTTNEPTLFDPAAKLASTPTPSGLPDHVLRRLEKMGLRDPDTGAMRRARAALCQTCRRPVMRGVNRDWGGISIDCDPTPITAQGELDALITGRHTYDLQWHGGNGYRLDRRESAHIRQTPPGTPGIDVLVVHSCGSPPMEATTSNIRDVHAKQTLPTEPPF